MNKWERLVDRLITDSIGDGDVSHLPGAGKSLPLKYDSNTPDDLRAAFKIMEDHNVMPEWIETGRRLEQLEASLRRQIEARTQQYLRESQRARQDPGSPLVAQLESSWHRYQERYLERVKRYNREALTYNLTLPKGIPHRQALRGERLIEQALRQSGSR